MWSMFLLIWYMAGFITISNAFSSIKSIHRMKLAFPREKHDPFLRISSRCNTASNWNVFGRIEPLLKISSWGNSVPKWDIFGRVPHDEVFFNMWTLTDPGLYKRTMTEAVSQAMVKNIDFLFHYFDNLGS